MQALSVEVVVEPREGVTAPTYKSRVVKGRNREISHRVLDPLVPPPLELLSHDSLGVDGTPTCLGAPKGLPGLGDRRPRGRTTAIRAGGAVPSRASPLPEGNPGKADVTSQDARSRRCDGGLLAGRRGRAAKERTPVRPGAQTRALPAAGLPYASRAGRAVARWSQAAQTSRRVHCYHCEALVTECGAISSRTHWKPRRGFEAGSDKV